MGVTTRRDGYVGGITLSRPAALNTFSTDLARDLDDALSSFERDSAIRGIVIDGAGEAFSAGIDLTEYADRESKGEFEEWVTVMETPFQTVAEMRTPVIAAVHGHAAANGIGLVAACDLAVATESAKFGATAPKVGLFCMGPAVPLRESLTQKRCLELLLTGELIDAETALEWGLINRVVDDGDHRQAAADLAETIAAKSPMAVQLGKEAFYAMADMPPEEALAYSNERFAELCTTADARNGIKAFLEGDPLSGTDWPDTDH